MIWGYHYFRKHPYLFVAVFFFGRTFFATCRRSFRTARHSNVPSAARTEGGFFSHPKGGQFYVGMFGVVGSHRGNLDLFKVMFLGIRSHGIHHHEANHQLWDDIFGSLFPGIELPANPRENAHLVGFFWTDFPTRFPGILETRFPKRRNAWEFPIQKNLLRSLYSPEPTFTFGDLDVLEVAAGCADGVTVSSTTGPVNWWWTPFNTLNGKIQTGHLFEEVALSHADSQNGSECIWSIHTLCPHTCHHSQGTQTIHTAAGNQWWTTWSSWGSRYDWALVTTNLWCPLWRLYFLCAGFQLAIHTNGTGAQLSPVLCIKSVGKWVRSSCDLERPFLRDGYTCRAPPDHAKTPSRGKIFRKPCQSSGFFSSFGGPVTPNHSFGRPW